jgi:hypothetical protein
MDRMAVFFSTDLTKKAKKPRPGDEAESNAFGMRRPDAIDQKALERMIGEAPPKKVLREGQMEEAILRGLKELQDQTAPPDRSLSKHIFIISPFPYDVSGHADNNQGILFHFVSPSFFQDGSDTSGFNGWCLNSPLSPYLGPRGNHRIQDDTLTATELSHLLETYRLGCTPSEAVDVNVKITAGEDAELMATSGPVTFERFRPGQSAFIIVLVQLNEILPHESPDAEIALRETMRMVCSSILRVELTYRLPGLLFGGSTCLTTTAEVCISRHPLDFTAYYGLTSTDKVRCKYVLKAAAAQMLSLGQYDGADSLVRDCDMPKVYRRVCKEIRHICAVEELEDEIIAANLRRLDEDEADRDEAADGSNMGNRTPPKSLQNASLGSRVTDAAHLVWRKIRKSSRSKPNEDDEHRRLLDLDDDMLEVRR